MFVIGISGICLGYSSRELLLILSWGERKWKEAQNDLQQICNVLVGWPSIGRELGLAPGRIEEIGSRLNKVYLENKGLL